MAPMRCASCQRWSSAGVSPSCATSQHVALCLIGSSSWTYMAHSGHCQHLELSGLFPLFEITTKIVTTLIAVCLVLLSASDIATFLAIDTGVWLALLENSSCYNSPPSRWRVVAEHGLSTRTQDSIFEHKLVVCLEQGVGVAWRTKTGHEHPSLRTGIRETCDESMLRVGCV